MGGKQILNSNDEDRGWIQYVCEYKSSSFKIMVFCTGSAYVLFFYIPRLVVVVDSDCSSTFMANKVDAA